MFVAILVTILAIFLSNLNLKGTKVTGLKLAFTVITVYLAIRYDYGNDYMSYLDSFYRYKSYSGSLFDFQALKEMHGHGDLGWVFINLLFRPVGFFVMIIVLTIFENAVLYDFVKRYVPKEWYPLAIFLYMVNTNLMVVGASMMRQWLAICIFIYCYRFIRDKKPIQYFVLIFIATKIHSSANILYPFYFMAYLKDIKTSIRSLYWFVPFTVAWFVIAPTVLSNNLGFLFSMESFDNYEQYTEGTGEQYGILGIIAAFLFPVACIAQANKIESDQRPLIFLYFCSILIRPLGLVIGMVNRMSFYFMVFSIAVFPMVLRELKKNRIEYVYIFLVIIILPLLRSYWDFFHSEVWIEHFMTYQTIFSQSWK